MYFRKSTKIEKANVMEIKILTHFNPMFHYYTPGNLWFLTFSGGIEMEH